MLDWSSDVQLCVCMCMCETPLLMHTRLCLYICGAQSRQVHDTSSLRLVWRRQAGGDTTPMKDAGWRLLKMNQSLCTQFSRSLGGVLCRT